MRKRGWFGRSCAAVVVLLSGLMVLPQASDADSEVLLPSPINLQRDGMQAASRAKPVVILFSLPGCVFCRVVRQNYLAPLVRDLPQDEQPVICEVQIMAAETFIGFQGEVLSHRAFSARYRVRFAPTVLLLGASGQLLSPPIVGGDTAGLYGGYLDNAFADAARKLAAGKQNKTRETE